MVSSSACLPSLLVEKPSLSLPADVGNQQSAKANPKKPCFWHSQPLHPAADLIHRQPVECLTRMGTDEPLASTGQLAATAASARSSTRR